MEEAYAEHFANGAGTLDEYAQVILSCLLKRGEFSGLQDVVGVNVFPVEGNEFAIDVEVSHVKVRGNFSHAFARDDSNFFLCGVLDFRALDERGRPHGDVLLRIIHDGHGNCGWRGDPSVLHSTVPPGVPEGHRFRQPILKLLRFKIFELLEASPLQPL
ncbi:hypothetical protein ACTJK4_25000 [Ralstonia sp. 22111]|uniref:hypothetical protein n=1 Tax=Ralstonia sp. 22111 TaxID=3453878 RepID=UPI003F85211E